jgi:hypothetical protein
VVPDHEVENSIESLRTGCDDSNIDPYERGMEAMPKKKTLVRNPWTKEDLRRGCHVNLAPAERESKGSALVQTAVAARQF